MSSAPPSRSPRRSRSAPTSSCGWQHLGSGRPRSSAPVGACDRRERDRARGRRTCPARPRWPRSSALTVYRCRPERRGVTAPTSTTFPSRAAARRRRDATSAAIAAAMPPAAGGRAGAVLDASPRSGGVRRSSATRTAFARSRAARSSSISGSRRELVARRGQRRAGARRHPGCAPERAVDLGGAQPEVARGRVELAVEVGGEELVELGRVRRGAWSSVMVSGSWMLGRGLPVPEQIGQRGATARDPGADGARRDAEHGRDLGVVHAHEVAERDRGAILGGQMGRARRRRRAGRRPRVGGSVPECPTVAWPDLRCSGSALGRDRPPGRGGGPRRARRSSRPGRPRSRTWRGRRTSRSCARSRATLPAWRRARRRDCRGSAGTRRARARCGRAAARRARAVTVSGPASQNVVVLVVPHRRRSLLPIDPGDPHDAADRCERR